MEPDKFKVGQLARIILDIPIKGCVVKIVEQRKQLSRLNAWSNSLVTAFSYIVSITPIDEQKIVYKHKEGLYSVSEEYLGPVENLNKTLSWAECSWRPNANMLRNLQGLKNG